MSIPPFSGPPTPTFTDTTPTPTTIGGIPAGSTFTNTPLPTMWRELLYPYQFPAFTSFSITGQATAIEVGTAVSGTKTFTWASSNTANVVTNSVAITGPNALNSTGHPASGSASIDVGTNLLTGIGSATWTATGEDTESNFYSRNFTVNWYWLVFNGTSASVTLDETAIEALTTSSLSGSGLHTYSFTTGDYKYICYPVVYPAASLFTDTQTGFDVTMADVSDNAAYSNTANGYSYAIVSVTNGLSQTTNYRVYRTRFVLGGSIDIAVT